MDANNINDEDEDVIIKGSSLYEHLYKLGYTDFESITIKKLTPKNEEKNSKIFDFMLNVKNVCKKLYTICLGLIQDDNMSSKQVETILSAKILLNDHGYAIHSLLDKYDYKPWRSMILKLALFGTILSSSMYISYNTHYKDSANLFALAVLCYTSYMEFLRVNAHMKLKSIVSLQNDLFDLCKKGMKILKYGYRIKLSKGKSSQQFSDLTAGRLKYLQPIMENLVKYLGDISCIYYHASLIVIKLLPANVCNEDLLTRFEERSFEVHGEINYQKLKMLYHTYILTQSEMLHLLAIAYDNHTWRQAYKKIPELKLAYIVRFLITHLTTYKNKLSQPIHDYYSFKLEPVSYKYKGPDSLQDLYMHLYLASNKLQLAYSHILSILQDIDNGIIENITNVVSAESTAQKLNATQKSIETAKDFIEFSSLLLVKSQIDSSMVDHLEMNVPTSAINSDNRIVTDSEPEVMDEVFEEYIKEEYLKPLSEEADEISLYNYKRDKTLFKNFMTELKDALVDKKKSMFERELKALQRKYKTIVEDITEDSHPRRIPTPPPMPSDNIPSLIQNNNEISNDTTKLQSDELPVKPNIIESINKSEKNLEESNMHDILMQRTSPISAISLPKNAEFSSFLPPPFLKTQEETFIGSGENSEDDEQTEVKTE